MSRRPADSSPSPKDSSADKLSFEDAMSELESIVQEMDGDEVPLETLLDKFSRGKKLLSFCQNRIDEAQQRVELISAGQDGTLIQPFSPTDSPTSNPGRPSKATSLSSSAELEDDIRLH